jgi:DNA-binding response OmpR family regulator
MAGKRICLIDDEADFTELTGTLLGFHGYDVATYNNPIEGLAEASKSSYDALVVDIMMPELDGLSVMRALRGGAYPDVPIFALSAKRLSDDERKFLLENKIHYVQKPFEPRRLVDLIAKAFSS